MTTRFRLLCLSAVTYIVAFAGAGNFAQARPRHLVDDVVVELYTAQGCATCPKANGVVDRLADKKGVLPLTFSVDYWDYLGWTDTLAKPEFTARQRAYAGRLKVREIYTPEIVVQGSAESPALEQGKIDGQIAAAESRRRRGPHVKISRRGSRATVTGAGPQADVWLIRYDPKPESVTIKAGENKGQTVAIRNGVRELKRLGIWRGAAKTYAISPAGEKGLKTVILVQAPRGGRILAARG